MKILYCGISSRYIHTMPAGWFLSEYLSSCGIEINEIYHNVNESYDNILNNIIEIKPDKLLLSVYIFNVEFVKKLIKDIRHNLKNTIIIVGGPEVDKNLDADHIVYGEGERALLKLLTEGGGREIYEEPIACLDDLPSPYTTSRLIESRNKLVYYESSRGCPFKCSYCMAGMTKGVRNFSLDRVKSDLVKIVDSGAKVVKFTDRTFNANRERTDEILRYIKDTFSNINICFHFEVGGDLFQQSTLDILQSMPVGLVQMEAGVQTLNPMSLKAINRVFDKRVFGDNISKIISYGNIHMHLDLIAGLPMDDLDSFKQSFNEVIALQPHMLQLGFLKMLKGTPIREDYKAEFAPIAPYEIISTPHMSEEDLKELKAVELMVDKLYNRGKFSNTLKFLLSNYDSPYDMYFNISKYLSNIGVVKGSQEVDYYNGLLRMSNNEEVVRDYLRYDYLITNNSKVIPHILRAQHSEEFKLFNAQNKPTRTVFYEEFKYLPSLSKGRYIVRFDYQFRNPVNKQYSYSIIK